MLLLEQFPNLMFVFNKYLLFQKVFLYSQEQYFLKKRITDRIFQGINGDYICRRERYWETHIKENIIFSPMTTTIHQCKTKKRSWEKFVAYLYLIENIVVFITAKILLFCYQFRLKLTENYLQTLGDFAKIFLGAFFYSVHYPYRSWNLADKRLLRNEVARYDVSCYAWAEYLTR